MMALLNSERSASRGAQGYFSLTSTVLSSTAVTLSMAALMKPQPSPPVFVSSSMENLTSAAVSGFPSENFTPLRRVIVYVSLSSDIL